LARPLPRRGEALIAGHAASPCLGCMCDRRPRPDGCLPAVDGCAGACWPARSVALQGLRKARQSSPLRRWQHWRIGL